ncbi:MAG: copper resistance protein CopC [Microcella sp.]|nr:copper resistance protein CopC [Microcella sp.]
MSSFRASALAPFAVASALAASLVVGLVAPASAHNSVVSSTPEQDEVVTVLPDTWQLTTNEDMLDLGGQGAGFALLIADDAGLFYGDGCVTVQGASMTTPAALGNPGLYSMVYQAISADGHTLSGELTFTWQPDESVEPHLGLAEPPVCGETASAPAPDNDASADTESTDEPVAAPEPIEPINDEMPVVGIVGIALGALVLIGATVAIVAASRARAARTAETDAVD